MMQKSVWTRLRRAGLLLEVLSNGESISKSGLIRKTMTSSSALYGDIDALEEKGLITINEMARTKFVRITDDGRKLLETINLVLDEWEKP